MYVYKNIFQIFGIQCIECNAEAAKGSRVPQRIECVALNRGAWGLLQAFRLGLYDVYMYQFVKPILGRHPMGRGSGAHLCCSRAGTTAVGPQQLHDGLACGHITQYQVGITQCQVIHRRIALHFPNSIYFANRHRPLKSAHCGHEGSGEIACGAIHRSLLLAMQPDNGWCQVPMSQAVAESLHALGHPMCAGSRAKRAVRSAPMRRCGACVLQMWGVTADCQRRRMQLHGAVAVILPLWWGTCWGHDGSCSLTSGSTGHDEGRHLVTRQDV